METCASLTPLIEQQDTHFPSFLCVKTNVCYQVVGLFVIQQEDIESIKEALEIFRKWNPEWKPKNFMVDFADEEIQAIESIFPGKFSVVNF
jgi:hypothetical protein